MGNIAPILGCIVLIVCVEKILPLAFRKYLQSKMSSKRNTHKPQSRPIGIEYTNPEPYIIPPCYDSQGMEIKAGHIAMCTPGTEAKEPYEVELFECHEGNLYHGGQKVKTPYLCTRLTSGKGYSAVLWPYWSKRLTITGTGMKVNAWQEEADRLFKDIHI